MKREKIIENMLTQLISKKKFFSNKDIRNIKIFKQEKQMIIKNDNSLNNKITTQTSIKNSSTMSKILCFGNKSKNNNSDSNYRRDSIQSILIFKDKKIKNSETDGKRSPNYGNKIEISIKSKFAKETKIAISNIKNIDSKKNIFKNVNENILNKMMTYVTKKQKY